MEKKIEDYLHLYLGCEIMDFSLDKTSPKRFTLDVNNIGYPLKAGMNINGIIKPLLRPLSDMTEEEAIELAALSEWPPHFRDVKTARNKFNDIIVTWEGMVEGGETFNATGELFYCSEQFQWLLEKGFDLFELILNGLAIAKPTPLTDSKEQDSKQ